MDTFDCNCIMEVLVVKNVESVFESLSYLLLGLLCVSVVEGEDVTGSEVLILWKSGGCGLAVISVTIDTCYMVYILVHCKGDVCLVCRRSWNA